MPGHTQLHIFISEPYHFSSPSFYPNTSLHRCYPPMVALDVLIVIISLLCDGVVDDVDDDDQA